MISGIVAFLCFLAVPFLPVNQTQSSLSWPQDGELASVNAPLMSYSPERIEASIPLATHDTLNPGEELILGTLPTDSPEAGQRGLFVRAADDNIEISSAGEFIYRLTAEQIDRLPEDATLDLVLAEDEVTASVSGAGLSPEALSSGNLVEKTTQDEDDDRTTDYRPQVTGIYTEIADTAAHRTEFIDHGLSVDVEINSRFTSSPSVLKYLAMAGGVVALIVSLGCLWRLDRLDHRRVTPLLSKQDFTPRASDAAVAATLVVWHFFGGNTADDGYLLTMARAAENSGYMANYYRWFGVPEAPFGSPYYDLLTLMTRVTTASTWMRLPALISGLVIWFVLSRKVLPRLGDHLANRNLVVWTTAAVFLAFWLPYDNGTRPEPVIAMGALVSWALFERGIATRRLLPAAIALLIATFTLGAGPTGLMAVAAFLVSLPQLIRVLRSRRHLTGGVMPQLAPFLGAGTAILIAVFGDQTLAGVLESTRVRSEIGPALPWYQEFVRYESLFSTGSVDGAFTRRLPMFILFVSLVTVTIAFVRWRAVPGARRGPSLRLTGIVFGTIFFMMFTPTKWTHHFGVYAGIGAALAGLAAIVISRLVRRSVLASVFITAGFLLLFALALAGDNGWWYVSSFAIPWWDRPVQYHAILATTVVLVVAVLLALVSVVRSLVADLRHRGFGVPGGMITRLAAAPIAVLAVITLVFSMASFAKAFVSQYPRYTVGKGNVSDLTGQTCAMAAEVLVEANTNDSFLTPVDDIPLGESLEAGEHYGFSADGLPTDLSTDDVNSSDASGFARQASLQQQSATPDSDSSDDDASSAEEREGSAKGVNGSRHELPFDLDFTRVPVLGSYHSEDDADRAGAVTTAWYELPEERGEDTPVLAIAAAGSIEHHDINGVREKGQELVLEYGHRDAAGTVTDTGEAELYDVGTSTWRNLRLPLDDLPEGANVVRIKASDTSLGEDEWLAFTPPRVPELVGLTDYVIADAPGLIDWPVALQFPCQRPFDHYAGVAEIPEYRISPDGPGKKTLSPVQSYAGGGAMGIAEAVNESYELPAYLDGDWQRDWGSIEVYSPRTNSKGEAPKAARIDHEEITRSGLWNPSEMNIDTQD